jgi:hypothetical protein
MRWRSTREELQMRRLVSLAFAAIVLFVVAAPARAEIAAVKVIDEPGTQQVSASGNGAWFAFTANSATHPKRFNAYAEMVDGSGRRRLNPKGTGGFAGDFDPAATNDTVIYDQYSATTRSNLWFFDLVTKQRSQVPDVNTKWYEYNGHVSANYVLFTRDRKVNGVWWTRLNLYDRTHHTMHQIDAWKANTVIVIPGSVSDTTASFFLVKLRTGDNDSFVYDIALDSRTKIPVASGKFAYSPTIDEANQQVYYSVSGNGCGASVKIRRLPLADFTANPTLIASMPSGVDAYGLSLAPNTTSGNTDLLFTRYNCSNGVSHVFALPGVDTV